MVVLGGTFIPVSGSHPALAKCIGKCCCGPIRAIKLAVQVASLIGSPDELATMLADCNFTLSGGIESVEAIVCCKP